ncbi:DUF664 domain-containing protein [Streptomyces sp. MZ04]|nr:DUF664 domain-containing protein [Streptomyces sp. MZ04]
MTTLPDGRPVPGPTADERAMLADWLDFHRGTLAMKCVGLEDAQTRITSVPSSSLTLQAADGVLYGISPRSSGTGSSACRPGRTCLRCTRIRPGASPWTRSRHSPRPWPCGGARRR